ncbi:hypothetical protein KO504_05005 [Winogradskyella psychrotolerans]|uniref:hypothetical protein n=1 Tax=Winogradskyella psychrotolerans TaxID=1344585 RepID=UPI001C070839|nr:hypothetical protein [Winogradskyella psychrotolerans]MBU2920688.1 hypothetical protein [Winogradskyella psychrotolerans]
MQTEQQQAFLIEEIWLLTFGGAFQHTGIYKPKTKEIDRTRFRNKLRGYVENTILSQYKTSITEDTIHLENIQAIGQFTEVFTEVLKAPINIGVSQKLLNLALKYYWCLGIIPEPPHCPVDRIIQQRLYKQPLVNWTQLNCADTYMQIIHEIRSKAKDSQQSIAQWELVNFDRR